MAKLALGPKKGYKQSQEHIDKRSRWGSQHHAWKGNNVTPKSGRCRAIRQYPARPCHMCGNPIAERHHIDGNTANNGAENVVFLCRRHHMAADGRLLQFVEYGHIARRRAIASAALRQCFMCSSHRGPFRKGRCHACDEYLRRNGRDRPVP